MSKPKSIHDGLRRLYALVNCVEVDLTNYLENPAEYRSEYFEDVLEAAKEAKGLVGYVRKELKGV